MWGKNRGGCKYMMVDNGGLQREWVWLDIEMLMNGAVWIDVSGWVWMDG